MSSNTIRAERSEQEVTAATYHPESDFPLSFGTVGQAERWHAHVKYCWTYSNCLRGFRVAQGCSYGAGTNPEKPPEKGSPGCNPGLSQRTGNCQGRHSNQGNNPNPLNVGCGPMCPPAWQLSTRFTSQWAQIKHLHQNFQTRKPRN